MSCDIIIASENARFGQPEVNLGNYSRQRRHPTIDPSARQAPRDGIGFDRRYSERRATPSAWAWSIASCPVELVLEEAKNVARKIAAKPVLAIRAAKQAVLKAANAPLDEGLDFERKSFYLLLPSEDRKEGHEGLPGKTQPELKGRVRNRRRGLRNHPLRKASGLATITSIVRRRSTPSCRR